ncbi:MAG: hydantoinase/oxoprolinase family protein, partial [Planctomycetaceae bacterium]
MSNPLGLDIGGANIKASDGLGCSVSREFAIWKQPDQLVPVLKEVLSTFPNAPVIAATMTAELADCFATKSEGVTTIVDALVASASGRRIRFWQTVGEFVDPDDAKEFWSLTAASNWHALSTWAGRLAPSGCTVLIDVGSTTCDIIPIEYGLPQPQGRTDGERLRSGELLYTGVKRTPICALSRKVMWNGEQVPLAAELFATSRDVYLITGELPERPDERDTADGRPATRDAAFQRLARMLCCDQTEVTDAELVAVARSLAATQHSHVA